MTGRSTTDYPYVHGRVSTYANGYCRSCAACRAAWARRVATARAARRLRRELVDGRMVSTANVRHGHSSTYVNWFCRCPPCTAAHSVRHAGYRQRRRDARNRALDRALDPTPPTEAS